MMFPTFIGGKSKMVPSTGVPLGYEVDNTGVRYLLFNHLNLKIHFHTREEGTLRVVGFEVEPKSINYDMKVEDDAKNCIIADRSPLILENKDRKGMEVMFTYSVEFQ